MNHYSVIQPAHGLDIADLPDDEKMESMNLEPELRAVVRSVPDMHRIT